jgi:predicted metal-binding membrane protein
LRGAADLNRAVPSVPPSVVRQRNVILVVLLVLAAAGWIVFLRQAQQPMDMDMTMGSEVMGPDLTMGRSWPLFFAMWVAMMIAMMFPSAAPMIVMYGRMKQGDPLAVTLFTGSYISLWFAFGGLAFLLGAGVEVAAERSAWVATNWARAGGGLLATAGLYQLTPFKNFCLRHCRTPIAFAMDHWRDGRWGAVQMGTIHGLYCMGCCWALFLIMIPLGVMNVAAAASIALVVFVEKVMPWGSAFGRAAGVILMLYGALVVLRPGLLPTVA